MDKNAIREVMNPVMSMQQCGEEESVILEGVKVPSDKDINLEDEFVLN